MNGEDMDERDREHRCWQEKKQKGAKGEGNNAGERPYPWSVSARTLTHACACETRGMKGADVGIKFPDNATPGRSSEDCREWKIKKKKRKRDYELSRIGQELEYRTLITAKSGAYILDGKEKKISTRYLPGVQR